MSKHNRERRERARQMKAIVMPEGHPIYSEATLAKLAALEGKPGANKVGVFHEQFCADALRRGAPRCVCDPEVVILEADSTVPREQRALENHWLTQEEKGGRRMNTTDLFESGGSTSKRYRLLMSKARAVNAKRDQIDHQAGHPAPGDCPIDMHLRTAISALVCGIDMEDWDCVAEGLDMLQRAELRLRAQEVT